MFIIHETEKLELSEICEEILMFHVSFGDTSIIVHGSQGSIEFHRLVQLDKELRVRFAARIHYVSNSVDRSRTIIHLRQA